MVAHEFSVGVLHGWHGVLLGLAASVVFLIAGWQDVGPGIGMTSSALWFLLALISTGGVIWLGVGARPVLVSVSGSGNRLAVGGELIAAYSIDAIDRNEQRNNVPHWLRRKPQEDKVTDRSRNLDDVSCHRATTQIATTGLPHPRLLAYSIARLAVFLFGYYANRDDMIARVRPGSTRNQTAGT